MSPTAAADLVSIGAFARRTRLSVNVLGLYAEMELLAPAWVDPETGYRYYAVDQGDRARLIGLLRRLDMPLARKGREMAASPREVYFADDEVPATDPFCDVAFPIR